MAFFDNFQYTIITMNSPTSEAMRPPQANNKEKADKNPRIKQLTKGIRDKISKGERPLEAVRDASADSPEAEAAQFIKEEPRPIREYPTTPEDRIKGEIARIQNSPFDKDKVINTKLPAEIQEAVQKAFDSGTPKTTKLTDEQKKVENAENKKNLTLESKRIDELMLQAQRKTNYLEKQKIQRIGQELNLGHKPPSYKDTLSSEQMNEEIKKATPNTAPEDKMAKLFTKQDATTTTTTETSGSTAPTSWGADWEKFKAEMKYADEFYKNPPADRRGDEPPYTYLARTNFDKNPPKNYIPGESWDDYVLRGGPEDLLPAPLEDASLTTGTTEAASPPQDSQAAETSKTPQSNLTPEAQDLLKKIDSGGGIPFAMTSNLAQIARENYIDPNIGVTEVFAALKKANIPVKAEDTKAASDTDSTDATFTEWPDFPIRFKKQRITPDTPSKSDDIIDFTGSTQPNDEQVTDVSDTTTDQPPAKGRLGKIFGRFGRKDKTQTDTTSVQDSTKPVETLSTPKPDDEYVIDFTGSKQPKNEQITTELDKAEDQSPKKGGLNKIFGRFGRKGNAETDTAGTVATEDQSAPTTSTEKPFDTGPKTESTDPLEQLSIQELSDVLDTINKSQNERYNADDQAKYDKVYRIMTNKSADRSKELAEIIKKGTEITPELAEEIDSLYYPGMSDKPKEELLGELDNSFTGGGPNIYFEGTKAEIEAEIQRLSSLDTKSPVRIRRLNEILQERKRDTASVWLNQYRSGKNIPMDEAMLELTGSVPDNLTPELFEAKLREIANPA